MGDDRWMSFETVKQDLWQPIVSLVRQPVLPIVIVLTMTFSVGANLAVLTIVNALWIRSRPIPNPDRTVMVMSSDDRGVISERLYLSPLTLADIGTQPAFEMVAGQVPTAGEMTGNLVRVTMSGRGAIETLAVTHTYFATLGLQIRGRDFARTDDLPGAPLTAIVSDRFWRSVLGESSAAIGSTVTFAPAPLQVIGVAPAGFRGLRLGEQVDLWVSRYAMSRLSPEMGQPDPNLLGIARLRPGVTLREAERQISEATGIPVPVRVISASALYGSPVTATVSLWRADVLWIALITASLVLLGGCATLMAIMLVQYERRREEFAIRIVLGSSRERLLRRLRIELAPVALMGAIGAGLAATAWLRAVPAVTIAGGIDLSRIDLRPDWLVTFGALVLAVGAMVGASLVPLRRSVRLDPAAEVSLASSRHTASSQKLLQTLLGVHAAASVVVLVAAGLFVRMVAVGFSKGPGFDVDSLLFVSVYHRAPFSAALSDGQRAERAARNADRFHRLVETLSARADIEAVALGPPPLGTTAATAAAIARTIRTEGRDSVMRISLLPVGVDFADALGLRLKAGRPLQPSDVRPGGEPGERAVLVTQAVAGALWPGRPGIGRRFSLSGRTTYVVVGIVDDFAVGSFRLDHRAAVLLPTDLAQAVRQARVDLVIRSRQQADGLKPAVRLTLEDLLGSPGTHLTTGRELVSTDLGRERLGAWFFSAFGLVALVLTTGGGFGVTAYVLDARRREMAIRLALGASHGRVARHVLLGALRPVTAGVVGGLLVAFLLAFLGSTWVEGLGRPEWDAYAASGTIVLAGAGAAGGLALMRLRQVSPGAILNAG